MNSDKKSFKGNFCLKEITTILEICYIEGPSKNRQVNEIISGICLIFESPLFKLNKSTTYFSSKVTDTSVFSN